MSKEELRDRLTELLDPVYEYEFGNIIAVDTKATDERDNKLVELIKEYCTRNRSKTKV